MRLQSLVRAPALIASVLASVPPVSAAAARPHDADALASRAARSLVACVARDPGSRGTPEAARRDVADRIASLNLAIVGSLVDGLPAIAPPAASNPFDLDPARVVLLEAPDSAAAARARDALADDRAFEWVEPLRVREAAVVSLRPLDAYGSAHAAHRPGAARTAGRRDPSGTAPAPSDLPDDPLLRDTRQWGLWNAGPAGVYGGTAGADVNAPAAWRRTTGARPVRLGVADTGIDPDHPDLQMILPGGTRIETGVDFTDDRGVAADSVGHGTAVAGVMAARTGDGAHFDSLGVAGVCGGDGGGNPGCTIVPLKIARVNGASSFDIARAILHATVKGVRALNLSFAGPGPSRLERLALYHAITRGCVVVAAAGNRGASAGAAAQYPAAYAADGLCIQAGASDPHDRRAAFSSYGRGLDLLAPGVDVWTTFMTYPSANGTSYPGYAVASGTSFAAPFVTGAVGLLAAARPDLADADFQHVLREAAADVGAPGRDRETGWGRLDAAAALAAVPPDFGVWHDEVAADAWIERERDTLTVIESGPGSMDRVRSWTGARLIEVRATVALPDSFVDSVRVWPRVGGTMTVRDGFRLPYFAPWAEVIEEREAAGGSGTHGLARAASLDLRAGARAFTLRGYLYRDDDAPADSAGAPDPPERFLPLPPDQMRFGFTVIGRVARAAAVDRTAHAPALAAAPNPFHAALRIRVPGAGRIAVYDVAGRLLRRLEARASVGDVLWDGRDDAGRPIGPGLYLIRHEGGGGRRHIKVLKLD